MKDFILPDIGEGIVECELLAWLVKEGDVISEDQPVAEVMTDKATVQIPAMFSGTVKKLYYQAGDIAKVHEPLFAMDIDVDVDTTELAEEPLLVPSAVKEVAKATIVNASEEDFILPDIGEGIVECEVVKWLIEEGQTIAEDQAVVEVMTDKALVEIPAKHSGKVTKLYYAQGETARVHSPLYAMQIDGEFSQSSTETEQDAVIQTSNIPEKSQKSVSQGKAIASPAVRRQAREQGIDIAEVLGSGKKGRVLKTDLSAHKDQNSATATTTSSNASVATANSEQDSKVTIRGIQAVMAKRMSDAVFSIPHFSVSDEVLMDKLIDARNQLKPEFERMDVKLSFMPFFIKALSMALKSFPIINSQVNSDCTELTYKKDHNIGIAIDSKIGLLVPNIKRVQDLTLFEIAKQLNRLIDLARDGKLAGADLKGGTISISNIGVLGGTTATPVINKPEAAIVAIGKMQRLPRFDDNDNVIAANIMHVSWSGDHRIIDGATMVRFNNLWMSYLQNPLVMLTELR